MLQSRCPATKEIPCPQVTEAQITEWIASQKQAMIDLLRDAVNIDSGSYDKPGVDAVGARFEQHFAAHGIEAWREPHDVFGDALHALVAKPGSNEKPVLLMGHRDTVFPKGEVARRPFTIEGSRAYGPGVADMKAGLVINAFVAAAFQKFGSAPCPIKLLDHRRRGDRVAIVAPGDRTRSPHGARGVQFRTRAADGQRRHQPQRRRVHALRNCRQGGAFRRQFCARHQRDRRTRAQDRADPCVDRSCQGHHPQCRAGLRRPVGQHDRAVCRGPDRHALHRTRRPRKNAGGDRENHRDIHRCRGLWQSCMSTANSSPWCRTRRQKTCSTPIARRPRDAGLPNVEGEFAGGCADSGFTASVGTPTICGVGPVGGNAHTAQEYLELDSIVPRAQTLALAILRTGVD